MQIPISRCWFLGLLGAGSLFADALPNGSFENGLESFWSNAPADIRIDSTHAARGTSSLALTTRGPEASPASVYAVIPQARTGTVYRFTCQAMTDAPGHVTMQAQVMISADTPIGFWTPAHPAAAAAQNTIATNWSPDANWSTYGFTLGPVPEPFGGKPVRRIGVFLRAAGQAGRTLWIDDLQVTEVGQAGTEAAQPKPAVAVDLRLPSPVQIFTRAVPVEAIAQSAPPAARIVCEIRDAHGREVRRLQADGSALGFVLDRAGYYEMTAAVLAQDGTTVATARRSLCITTPLPADYYETALPAFGAWGLDADLLRLGGAKWTRQPSWQVFEERKGLLSGTSPDGAAVAARGPIRVIRQLNLLSPFKPMGPLPREQWADASAYLARAIASRRGLVDVWETQNEPMVGENFHGSLQDVYDLMKLVADAVHANDPERPVAGVCINPMVPGQYAQILAYYRDFGAAGLLDGVVLHPYTAMARSPDQANLTGTLNRLAADLQAIAGRPVPLYITEIGYATRPQGEVTELQQAAYLVRTLLLTQQVPTLQATIWHIGYYQAGKNSREGSFSLLRYVPGRPDEAREPKPAYAAWATASRQLYNARFQRLLDLSANCVGLLYERAGQPLVIAYTRDDASVRTRLLVGAEQVAVTRLCGETETVPSPGGVLELTLDAAPLYIVGAAPELFSGSALAARFSPETPTVRPGQTVEARIEFGPLGRLDGADVVAEVPPGWRTAPVLERDRIEIALTAPPDAQPGHVPLLVKVQTGSRIRYAWQRNVAVVAPVVLEDVRAAVLADGRVGLRLRRTPADVAVLLRVMQGDRTVALLPLPAAESCEIPLYDTEIGRAVPLTAALSLPTGYGWRQPLPDPPAFAIPRLDTNPDGVLDEWAGVNWHALGSSAGDTAHGRLAFAWDDRNLLLAVDANDTTPHAGERNGSMFAADSVQLAVAVDPAAMLRPNNIGIQETAYAEIGLTDGQPPASWVWASMNGTAMPLNQAVPGLAASVRASRDRAIYEAAIPWASLGIRPPRAGLAVRLAVVLNDRTAKERRVVEWYGGIAQGKDPQAFGLGLLTGAARREPSP